MTKSTCSADGCQKDVRARGLCGSHYNAERRELRRAGVGGDSRPCLGCGSAIHRTKPRGAITTYCSDACKPRCTIKDCDEPIRSRGWCVFHYSRWAACGNAEAPLVVRHHKGEVCVVEGCEQRQRKREWCSSHYNQWRDTGSISSLRYTWAKDLLCAVCGNATGSTRGRRKYCSDACAKLWLRHQGAVPASAPCVRCRKDIRLATRGKAGRRRRADVKLCRRCRMDIRKHGMSVEELARRDGADCGICDLTVDLNLRAPDLMRASVDHIYPRARGGNNDPGNLQLAHLICNCIKKDRIAVT